MATRKENHADERTFRNSKTVEQATKLIVKDYFNSHGGGRAKEFDKQAAAKKFSTLVSKNGVFEGLIEDMVEYLKELETQQKRR